MQHLRIHKTAIYRIHVYAKRRFTAPLHTENGDYSSCAYVPDFYRTCAYGLSEDFSAHRYARKGNLPHRRMHKTALYRTSAYVQRFCRTYAYMPAGPRCGSQGHLRELTTHQCPLPRRHGGAAGFARSEGIFGNARAAGTEPLFKTTPC